MHRIFALSKKKYVYFFLTLAAISLFVGVFYLLRNDAPYYTVVPVRATESNLPYLDVVIEGTSYPLEIDLGSRLEVKIHSNDLKQWDRTLHGTEVWRNFRGTTFEYPTYTLPKIEVGSLTFKNPIVVDAPLETDEECTIWQDPGEEIHPSTIGRLGRGLLKKTNFLLDMGRSQVILTNSLDKLKEAGY